MVLPTSVIRLSYISLTAALTLATNAAEPARIIFQNGKSIPITAVTLQGDKLVVTADIDGFKEKDALPLQFANYVFGEKPAEINQAIASMLMDRLQATQAQSILEPIVAQHQATAQIPGNFWIDAAKALLLSFALSGDATACNAIGKEISDATPTQGVDPFVALGKALLVNPLAKLEEREAALRAQTTDNLPAEVCAYASYFRGILLAKEKQDAKALEAFLMVTCIYPSGGMIINSAAEIQAADLMSAASKHEEALKLATSALRSSIGTKLLEDEANKRLESLK